MSEANGFNENSFEPANIFGRDLTPFSEVENTDVGIDRESSYLDSIEQEIESLNELATNIDRLEELPLAEGSELSLFAHAQPSFKAATTSNNPQLAGLDPLTGEEIHLSNSAAATIAPSNLNQSLFTNGESTRITLEFIQREASFRNEVGLYRVDDATGRIGDLSPGDDGYAEAALDPARRIFTLDDAATGIDFSVGIEPGTLFGSYLIQNNTSQRFLQKNSSNRLNKKPLAFFSFKESNPDNFDHLQTRVNDNGSIDLAWEDWTGGGDRDFTDAVFTISYGDAPMDQGTPNYAVKAEGQFKLRGRGDYDGDPNDLDDDVLIYAGKGFNLAGRQVLPVKRDEAGNPLVDEQNKYILVDDALTVAPNYSEGKATNSIKNLYSGLVPPQIVDQQIVSVPDYDLVKQEQVEAAIGDASPEVTLPAFTRLNTAERWSSNFPAPGTLENPTVVRVQRRGLTIPHQVDLSNYVIIVERGDINFQGSQHQLENVVLIAESGKIELGQSEVTDSSFLAAKSIKVRSNTNFAGDNLLANSSGKIELFNSQSELEAEDSLRVIAAGDLSIKGRSTLKGEFLTAEDFLGQGRTSLYGSVAAKGDVTFNGRVEMHATPEEEQQPEVRATLDSVTVAEDAGAATVTVTLDAASDEEVRVDFATGDDTAQAGLDYQAVNGTISFEPGETEKTIEIPLLNDQTYEGDEAFLVELTNPQGLILGAQQAVVSVTSDDPLPEITVNDITVEESNSTAEFTISLSNPSSLPVIIDYVTEDGTAIAGEDYVAQQGQLIFAPGETSATIAVELTGDSLDEVDEAFSLNLINVSNGTLGSNGAIATISDDDEPPELILADVAIAEGDSEVTLSTTTVTLSTHSSKEITVDYAIQDDTATAGADYVAQSGQLTFAPGETSKTIEIEINGDTLDELDENLVIEFSNPSNGILNVATATVAIIDNDEPPVAAIESVTLTEGDEESSNAVFAVSLDNPSSREITIDYTTIDGTAIAGEDYLAQTGTLTFKPGETSKTIEVVVTGDRIFESDEVFTVNLSNPTFATIDEDQGIATGTIINNDSPSLELNLNLVNDTGIDNTDQITSDPTIAGVIANIQENITLNATLANGENSALVEISDLIQPDGSFTLGLEQLKLINGGDLVDGTYALQLVATNSETGDVSSSELSFTLDTDAPTLNLTTPLVDGDHSITARLTGNVLETDLADVTYSLNGEEIGAITVDEAGNFDSKIDSNGLSIGIHSITAIATDIVGNQSSSEISFQVGDDFLIPTGTNGWGAEDESTLILGEQDSYVVQTSVPVELGLETNEDGELVGTRTISFDIDAVWDETDAKAIEDQLLVYLVDPANPSQTLLDNGTEGTAVFSLAGEQTDFTPGMVSFDGTTVTIDASSLTDVSQGLLVFQLLNSDDDTGSVVTVNNLASTTDIEGFVNPIFPEDNNTVAPGTALELDNLTEASEVATIIENVRFDADTGEYRADLSLMNNGDAISQNTAVVFNNLPDGVELLDASGTDITGNPYLNLRPAISSGGLDAGGVSDTVEVVFTNPNLVRFGLDTTVLTGSPNVAPILEPIDNLSVVPGQKLELNLVADDPNGDTVTFRLQNDGDLPTGMLDGNGTLKFNPQPDEIGSYEFTIIATDGAEEVSQTVTLDVVADPITTTRISGIIENVEQQPLAGVPIELGELSTVTNADGSFTIETDQPLTNDTLKVRGEAIEGDRVYPFIAEKLPLVLGQEVFAGFDNVIDRPIYLPALDVESGQVIDPTQNITVTTENIPGASVFVEAGSLSTQSGEAFTGTLSITQVPNDLTPAALPENVSPDMVVTIQPGEMVFETPAPLTFPNRAGYAPGTEMDLWSINPETGDFDKVGKMLVSADGSIIETVEGGIINSSWHFPAPPPPEPRPPEGDDRNEDNRCPECTASGGFNSEVEFHSGAVIETHNLTTYTSNGSNRGITLTYDSLRANPRPIVRFGYDDITPFNAQSKVIADLTIKGEDFEYQVPGYEGGEYGLDGGEHIWSIPRATGDLSIGLQVDLKNLPSGLYDYDLNSGLYQFANELFTGSSSTQSGDLVHVNSIDSNFGSGWSIAGWQKLVENSDGSVLLIDGDGGEMLFEVPDDGKEGYISPPGDFSTLEKLPKGFKRTTTDQTVYIFDDNNQLQSVTDRNGNRTSYSYGEEQQLTKIVDSVGLETRLLYNDDGRVASIIDPDQKSTKLEYDAAGNLIRITDPDGTTRTWSYDKNHLMASEIDQKGSKEEAFYDRSGRAKNAVLKDGSSVQINPLQTQGMYSTEATVNPLSAPEALVESSEQKPVASYVDGKGNVTSFELDRAGQEVGSTDGAGGKGTVERNEDNLIVSSLDAEGTLTEYTYNDRGNVLTIDESLTVANNAGGNALIVNGATTSSEPELAINATETVDALLEESGFDTTIVDDIPDDISQYEQIWDLRFDNSAALNETQTNQYLNLLQRGGDLFLLGENSVFADRNDSILNLIASAGGGELDFALTSPSQQLVAPFVSPNSDGNIVYEAPGGVTNPGTGQFITTDDRDRGAGVFFTEGSLSNALGGELTTIFDLNFLSDPGSDVNIQILLNNLTNIESTATSQTYTYDPVFNQVTSYTDELGNLTLNDIDPNNGNILSTTRVIGEVGGEDDFVTSYTYTEAGLVATMTDPEGRVMSYEYDNFGRLIREIQAVGTADEAAMQYEYDAAGNRTAVIDENGNRTEYEYDQQNRLIKVTEADPEDDGELASPVSTLTYDNAGNLIETLDGNNNLTQHQYDGLNRRIKTINSLGEETSYEYDNAGNVIAMVDGEGRRTVNSYDSRNRLIETIDPLGNSTKYQYDLNNNLTVITDALGNRTRNFYDSRDRLFRTINAEGNVVSYEHDEADNVVAITDANGNRTEYEYDDLNRQVKQVDALLQESSIIYDKVGNVLSTTDEAGRTTELTYDNRDRLITTTDAATGVASLEYDAVGNLLAVTDEENRTTRFIYDALNRQTEVIDPLTQKTVTTYDAVDNVTSITDANNHTTSFTYDRLNRPTVVTNHLGDTIETNYDKVGNVTDLTDELKRTTNFAYDDRNLQTSVTDPLGYVFTTEYDEVGNAVAVTDGRGNTTSYEYDKLYRLIKEIDANNESMVYSYDPVGNLLSITDELKRKTAFDYDELNRQVTLTDPLLNVTKSQYDQVGNLIAVTDANDHNTYFTYDKLNRPTVVTNHLGDTVTTEYDRVGNAVSITDELNRTTNFTYDQLDRQISVKDALDNITTLDYDPVGNLTSVTDANLHPTSYIYDELNRQTAITNALGDSFITEYDAVGNVIAVTDEEQRTTRFDYDERNLQTSVTNALDNTTTTEYDEVGNVIAITDANLNTTRFTYDKLNRQTVVTNAAGDTVETEYDAVDNVVAVTDELKRTTEFGYDERNYQTSVTDPLNHTTTSVYDPVGNLTSVTDANNHTTSYIYDELNRQIKILDHLNQFSTFSYDKVGNLISATDELDRTSTYTYDKLNRQLTFTDPQLQTTTNKYDPVGNLLSVTDPLNLVTTFGYDQLDRNTSVTNPNLETTTYSYDKVGNQLSITDPEQNTTSYTYDKLNRTLTDTNQLGHTRSYTYDPVGNVIQTSDRNGREISFTYDNLNRNRSEIWLDESGNAIRDISFGFDAASQLINASDPDSSYSYGYDLDGRMTSVSNAGTPNVPEVVLNYTYDPVDNLTQVRDSIDGVDAGIESFTYDELDRVTQITQSGDGVTDKRVDMSYDAASQMKDVTRYSDLSGTELVAESTYTFDKDSRLTDLVHQQNSETLAEFGLVYDQGSRITSFTTPDGVSDFTYDDSDQLVDASHDYQDNEAYSYDDNGNRTNSGYVTGDNNQLLSDGVYDYEYDNEGNRVKQTEIATGEVTEYQWDHRNRLVAAVTKDTNGNITANSEYTYDVFDNRISKSVDADGSGAGEAVEERYVLDEDHIALTFDGEGNLTERFLHGLGIDQVLAQENASGEVLWALTDHQNSVRVVLDNQGNVVNQISYDSFGQITNETNSDVDFRFSYTGREYDAETGNYYYRARYYDPKAGRFISEDPISFAAGDSNIYRYVGNNPLFYLDPSGFCGVSSSGGPGSNSGPNSFGGPDFFGPGGPGGSSGPGSNSGPNSFGGSDFFGPGFGPGFSPGSNSDPVSPIGPGSNSSPGGSNSNSDSGGDHSSDPGGRTIIYERMQPGKEYIQRSSNGDEILVDYNGVPIPGSERKPFIKRNSNGDISIVDRLGNPKPLSVDDVLRLGIIGGEGVAEALEESILLDEEFIGLTIYEGNPIRDILSNPALLLSNPFVYASNQLWLQQNSERIDNFYVDLQINAGEQFAQQALEYWAQRFVDGDRNNIDRSFSLFAGGLASLWTPGNSEKTLATLTTAWGLAKPASNLTLDKLGKGLKNYIDDIFRQADDINTNSTKSNSTLSPKVQEIIDDLRDNNTSVKLNPKDVDNLQEGNVRLEFEDGRGVNLRVETHPLESGGNPIRHANVEITRKNRKGRNKVIENIHITE